MTADQRTHTTEQFFFVCLFALLAASCFGATAGPPSKQDRSIYRSWVDHERYTGRPGSSPSNPSDYQQLAYELQALRETRTLTGMSVAQRAPYETISPPRNNLRNRVPLSLIHWNRTLDAFTPEQQRQALSTGITPEPIQTNVTVFAVSPVRPTTYRGASVQIALAANDFFEETGSSNTIRSLRLDAGDGNGWQDLVVDQNVNASYDTTGTKTLTVEVTLSNGTVLLASAPLEVAALSTIDPPQSVTLVADAPYNNTTGTVYVYKSPVSHTGLRCPVLVAEGFDMENNWDADKLYNTLNTNHLVDAIQAYGRDLIVLDYTNAMRNIFENAALARKAVSYINANRNNASDKFTVIGASMGGLVTRIALADMDKNPVVYGASHVNTWISFDSPHKGANIPLGLQEFFAFFQGETYMPVSVAHFYSLVNQPAARQMLLVHHSTTTTLAGNSSNATFQAALDAKGYPASCKKIAISNGSGYGLTQFYGEGEQILNWDNPGIEWLFCDAACDIYAISTTPSPVPKIFWGFHDTIAWFDETETTQYHYYPYPVDNAPGGTRSSFKQLFDEIKKSGHGGNGDYCAWPDHCFIPTVSSLGLNIAYCDYPLHYYPSVKAQSPFDEIHYPYSNEPHIDINANNKRWFMRAILEDYDSDGDGYDDYKEYLLGTAYDSATSKLEGATIQPLLEDTGFISLSWDGRPNVSYKIYFTETLARDWTLVETVNRYQNSPFTALCQLPRSTQTGFYKIVAEVRDPVTD